MEAQGPKQKNSPSFKVAQRQMQQDSLEQQQINLMKDVNELKNRLQQFMEVYSEMQHCSECRDETCQHIMKEEFSSSQQNSCIKSRRHVSQRVLPYTTIRQLHPSLSTTRHLPFLSVVKSYPPQLNSLPFPKHHCWSMSNIERSEPPLRRQNTWPQTDDSRRRQNPVVKVRDTLAFSEHINNFDEPRKDQSSSDSKRDEWLPNKADRSMQIFPDFSQGTQLTSHSAFSDLSSDQRTVMKEFSQPQTMRERNPFVKDASQDPMMSSVDIKRDRFSPDSCSEGFMLHALSQPLTEAQHFSGHSEASGHANFSDTPPLRQAPENMCVKEEYDTEPQEVQSTVEWHKGSSPEMSFSSQSSNLEETLYNFPVTESVNSEPSSQNTESDDADRHWESEVTYHKEDLSAVNQPPGYFPKSFVRTSSETAFETQQVRCINEWLNGNSPEMPFSSQSSNLEDTVKDLDEIVAVGSEQSYQNTESVPSNTMYYPYTYVSTRPYYSCNTVSVVSESVEGSHLKEIAYNTIEQDPKSVIRTQKVGRAHRRKVKPEVFIKEPVNDIAPVPSHPKEDVVSSSLLSMSAAEGNSDKECERIKTALDHLSLDDPEVGEADSGALKMRTESRETGTGKEMESCDFQSHEGQSIDVSDNNASREKEQVNEKTVDELSTSVTLLKLGSPKNTANTGISQASTCSAERETTPAKDFEKELPRSLERLRLEDPEDEQAVETRVPKRSNEGSETDFESLHKEESFNLSKMPKPANETADTEVSKLHGAKENDGSIEHTSEEKGQPSDNISL